MWSSASEGAGEVTRSKIVKQGWFGREITVLMVNGKSATGELTEVAEQYLVVTRNGAETQIMAHAIVAIRLADSREVEQ